MKQDGFDLATRVVNPILAKYRSYLVKKYGADVLSLKLPYLLHSDVYFYLQIERLWDALALGEISREEFAERLLALAKQQRSLPPEVLQIVRELFEALTGQSPPALQSTAIVEQKPAARLEDTTSTAKSQCGACPRCSIEGDYSKKVLVECRFCGELYCERHATPRLIATFGQYVADPERYRDLAPIVREHWMSTSGHPCTAYTIWFWRTYLESKKQAELSRRGGEERAKGRPPVAPKSRARERRMPTERSRNLRRKIVIPLLLILLPSLLHMFLNLFLNSDFDGDGLSNWNEIRQGLNFLDVDTDKDYLDDEYELRLGTNPLSKDTDGDGLSDWYEVVHDTNPLKADTDGDELNDSYELSIGTNPLDSDTDKDELIDSSELMEGTNPLINDTDRDGLLDGYELRIGTDPLKLDTDSDGLNDSKELNLGSNPLKADTDGDGLNDGFELGIGTNPLSRDTDNDELNDEEELRRGTNPLRSDTDGDDALDGVEVRIGTNPLINDTDRDGLLDGYELRIGTDPLRNWRMFFDEDAVKSALSKFFRREVAQLASALRGNTPAETAWNVLKWLHENISYDYEKSRGTKLIYSPPETVKLRKGICADYSLLTAALLLEAGLNEAYILLLSSSDSTGHAAAAVVVNGRTYVLDQTLPPLRYEEYEDYFSETHDSSVWRVRTAYKVTLNRLGEPSVEIIDPAQLPKDRGLTEAEISSAVYRALRSLNPRLRWDSALEPTARAALTAPSRAYLPYGYEGGIFYTLRLHPATLSVDFAEAWISEMFRGSKHVIDRYSRIYVYARQTPSDKKITIIIVLANP